MKHLKTICRDSKSGILVPCIMASKCLYYCIRQSTEIFLEMFEKSKQCQQVPKIALSLKSLLVQNVMGFAGSVRSINTLNSIDNKNVFQ